MSYARNAMGDIWSDLATAVSEAKYESSNVSYDQQMRCIEKANNSTLAKQIAARISDLNINWKPTGIYTKDQINKLMYELQLVTDEARASLLTVPQNSYGLGNARSYLDNNDARVTKYRTMAARGGKISAPLLKKEYVKSLDNVWHAFVTTAAVDCALTSGQRMKQSIDRAVDAARSVLGTIADVAGAALNAAKGTFNLIGWLGKYPYVPIGLVAFVAYMKYRTK
jgi:hypothetical protein